MDEALFREVIDRELGGSYNATVLLDDLVKLHVKALGFDPNRNNFQFKRGPLEKMQLTKFGDQIPAWKSFEGKQVNRNHLSKDNGARTNEPIGYIEAAYMKPDGIYLDLVLWKRTLSDSELSQLRIGSCHVSMEVEYTQPSITTSGVRTMSENSIVSFVGIAVLFDGIQPGDQNSGILAVENARLQDGSEAPDSTKHPEVVEGQISSTPSIPQGEVMDNLTPEQQEALSKELAEVRAQLEAVDAELKATKEAAEVTQADLEAKIAERDEKLSKLYKTEEEFYALQAQLNAMRETAFNDNIAKCFDMSALNDEQKSFVRGLFNDCYGTADVEPFLEKAANLIKVSQAATSATIEAAKVEDTSADGEGAEGETSADAAPEAAVNTESASAEEAPAPETEPAAEETSEAAAEPIIEAPSIAGKAPVTSDFKPELLRLR